MPRDMSVSSSHHTESSCIAVVGESCLFYRDDVRGFPSQNSIASSSSSREETKCFSLAKAFGERKM